MPYDDSSSPGSAWARPRGRPINKRPTIRDVAERAGVSTATVSYVLNGTGSVSPATADRVRACVEEMRYRANRVAVAHRTGQSTVLGLAVPDLTNPFFPEFAQGAHQVAADRGYSLMLIDSATSAAAESMDRLADHVPAGLIWVPDVDYEADGPIERLGFPVVGFDIESDTIDTVSADLYQGGRLQAEMALAAGHRRIGIVTGPEPSIPAQRRRQGLVDGLTDSGVATIAWMVPTDFTLLLPDDVGSTITDRRRKVTCIATANDIQAIAVLRILRRAGLRVPEDVSVIGFDDVDLAALVSPTLTTVALDPRRLGATAAELLVDRITSADGPRRHVCMPVTAVRRESLAST